MNSTNNLLAMPAAGEFLLYTSDDGKIRVQTRVENETIWMTQADLATLFGTTVANINIHIKNIYDEGELIREATIKESLIVRTEGTREVRRVLDFYNLDMIIAVGYRVNSLRGTQFRIWATARLKEYLIKGFTMDDDRLKSADGGNYFDELLARIRDIRSSEKVFWRKVLDIYATSIDYDPRTEESKRLFTTIQNKMHWAAHGHTAAEIVHERANGDLPNMGMTNWVGPSIRKGEIAIAKNYLTDGELNILNRVVTAYLEFAELQALSRTPMYMKDWITRLDDFLKMSGRELLTHAGAISHESALKKAQEAYDLFHGKRIEEESRVEKDFLVVAEGVKKIGKK